MAKARTDVESVVKLIINGEQAKTSMKEITDSLRRYETEFKNLKKEDNPKAYQDKADAIKKMKEALNAARDELKGTNEESKKFNMNWKDIAKGAVTVGALTAIGSSLLTYGTRIKEAYAETQKFRAILTNTFEGSSEMADNSLKMLTDFAAKTPYGLQEATEGYIKLVNRGIIPTQEEMVKMGDLAASQGKSLDQYIEALLDAQTGEFERLKEFGIRASKDGETVTLSFKGVTKEVDNTADAIKNAMLEFGSMNGVANSMEAVSKTIVGIESNIDDTWNQIFTKLGQKSEGFLTGFYSTYAGLLDWINEKVLGTKTAADSLSEAFEAQKSKVDNLESTLPSLLSRYDQLKSKSSLSKDEQAELQKIITQVATTVPTAATAFDKYGRALDINTAKAKEFIKIQRALLDFQNKDAIEATREELGKEERLRDLESRILANMVKNGISSPKEIETMRKGIEERSKKIDELANRYKGLRGIMSTDGKSSAGGEVTEAGKKLSEQTIGELKTRLAGLNKQLDETVKGSAQYKKIMAEIADVNKILNSDKTAKKEGAKAESEAAKALKEFEKLDKEYEKLGLSRLNDQLSKNEKEVASAEQKYNALIAKEREFLEMKGVTAAQVKATEDRIAEIEIAKWEDVKRIRIRQNEEMTEKIQELRNGLAQVHEHELQKERDRINKFYDQQETENAGNEEVLASLKQERIKDLADAEIREKRRLEEEKQRIESEYGTINGDKDAASLAKINKKYDDEILALKEKFSKELQATAEFQAALDAINANRAAEILVQEQEKEQSKRDFQIDMAQKASDTVFSIMANNRNDELNMRLSDLDKQREKELDNKNLTEAQKKAINDKYDKKVKEERTKAFQADQRASIAQAFINGALGITAAWTNPWTAPFVIPTIIATTAAQIAVIAAQKPKFAKGGFVPDGPSHASGGIKMIDSVTGAMVGEMEGGEPILSKETYRNNKATIDALLYSGQRMNGANISLDTNSLGQAERYYRTGGIAETVSGSLNIPAPVVNLNTQTEAQDNTEMVELMREMVGAAKNAWNYRTFEEAQIRIQQIRNSSSG